MTMEMANRGFVGTGSCRYLFTARNTEATLFMFPATMASAWP